MSLAREVVATEVRENVFQLNGVASAKAWDECKYCPIFRVGGGLGESQKIHGNVACPRRLLENSCRPVQRAVLRLPLRRPPGESQTWGDGQETSATINILGSGQRGVQTKRPRVKEVGRKECSTLEQVPSFESKVCEIWLPEFLSCAYLQQHTGSRRKSPMPDCCSCRNPADGGRGDIPEPEGGGILGTFTF